jgi:AraC-like DNA-binding protein
LKEPSISLAPVLILIGSAQSAFLALALIMKRAGNRKANLFLAVLLFTLSIGLIDGFLIVTNYYRLYPHLIGVERPLEFFYGPLLYFYVRELSSSKRIMFSWKQALHFIPVALKALLYIPLFRLSADEKARLWTLAMSSLEERRRALEFMDVILVIQMAVYLIVSLRLIMAYSSRIKQSFSSVERISLSWLRNLLILFFCLWIMFAFYVLFAAPSGLFREAGYLLYLMAAAVIYVMGFKGLMQPEIFSRFETARQAELIRTDPPSCDATYLLVGTPRDAGATRKVKYQRSSLTDEQSATILDQLTRIMETGRPFLDPELTLPELSERLSVSPNHLSQVINGKCKKSFFDFVNEYRIEEAKKLLLSPRFSHYSILGIALEVGFNSKSSFYTAFKKHTGMTPSQYKDLHA